MRARRQTGFHGAGLFAMRSIVLACLMAGCSVADAADGGADTPIDGGADAPATTCGPEGGSIDGAPCRCDSECEIGAVCYAESESGYPGGVCARRCRSGPCSFAASCWDRRGICAVPCTRAGQCGAGRRCDLLDGFCTAWCTSDADCGELPCDRHRGLCGVPAAEGAGVLAPCESGSACLSGVCLSDVGCITLCEVGVEGCPVGSRCLAGGDGLGFCAPSCRDAPCPRHLVCSGVASDGEPLCGPP